MDKNIKRGQNHRNSKIYKKKRRRQAYRDKQVFWVIVITIVVLFTLGALLISSRDDKKTEKAEATTTLPISESVIATSSSEVAETTTEAESETEEYEGLVKDKYPQIKVLVEQYFDAKNNADADKLAGLVDVLSDTIKDDLAKEKKIIESYSNIEVYTKPGLAENSYVVYAYYEAKFVGIKTPAPSSIVLYVMKAADKDTMYIHTWAADSDIGKYINKLNKKDEEVKAFFADVDKKLKKACKKDESLKVLCDALKGKE